MKKNYILPKSYFSYAFLFIFFILNKAIGQVPSGPDIRNLATGAAWNWSMDERAVFHNGYLFVGYALSDGRVGITRYDPDSGDISESIISTPDSEVRDDHVAPSITILSDGRLLAMHTLHLGDEFFYRISNNTTPRTLADWGPEVQWNLSTTNLFSNTYSLSGESNAIYNFYRGINDNPTVSISRDDAATWEDPIQLIRTTGSGLQRPYPKFATDEINRIDFTYTDGHPRVSSNSIYHLYYENGVFRNSNGSFFKNFQDLPIQHDGGERGTVVYQYSSDSWGTGEGPDDWIPDGPAWTWDTAYYSDGNPVTVFQVSLDNPSDPNNYLATRIFYYYARWTGTSWQKRMIAKAGRALYNTERDYSGGIAIDPDNPNVVYISSNAANPFDLSWTGTNVPLNTNDRYEIWKGTTSDGGLTFSWEPITENSTSDNLRPIVPKNHGQSQHAIWFSGQYNTYENWSSNTELVALFGDSNTVPVTGVSVDPSQRTIETGGTVALIATVSPTNASDTSVLWTTSDPDVASVDSQGNVTGIAEGTATITATTVDGSFTDNAEVTVETATVPVTGVSVDPSQRTIETGGTVALIATVSPTNASDTSVLWTTSDSDVASVDSQGNVTGIAEGTATITATTVDGSFTDNAEVTVETATIPVTGVSVDPSQRTIETGGTVALIATVSPTNASDTSVLWTTSDPDVASVDSQGNVTGIAEGTATITATTVDGSFTDNAEVTVETATVPVTGVSVDPSQRTIETGGTVALIATVSPTNASDTSVLWTTSDSDVASVDSQGNVTGIAEGTATITATTVDGSFTDNAEVTVETATIPVTGVSVDPSQRTIETGGIVALIAKVSPTNASDTSVLWTTSDPDVASVDSQGNVTGIAEGTATITATTVDGSFTDNAEVTVETATVPVTGVSVDPSQRTIETGGAVALIATVSPTNASDTSVLWTTSDPDVASVDSQGNVTGIAEGTATITATTVDGSFTDNAEVTVETATIPVTGVSVDPSQRTIETGGIVALIATVSPTNASDTSVLWTTSDPDVASVDSQGNVTGIAEGTATITATTVDGSFTDNAEVTVLAIEEFSIYPNPTSGTVYITVPINEIEDLNVKQVGLYQLSGKLIFEYTEQFSSERDNIFSINIAEVSSGLYLFRIIYEDNSDITKKILVRN